MGFGSVGRIDSIRFFDQRQKLRIVLDLGQIPGDKTIQLKMEICVPNVVDSRCSGIANDDRVGVLVAAQVDRVDRRSEEHTSELQSLAYLVCRLLLEKKNKTQSK